MTANTKEFWETNFNEPQWLQMSPDRFKSADQQYREMLEYAPAEYLAALKRLRDIGSTLVDISTQTSRIEDAMEKIDELQEKAKAQINEARRSL